MKWTGNNNYATPDYLFQALHMEFDFDLDPCPLNPEPTVDGLQLDWTGHRVFCNPPWGDIAPWVNKALNHEAQVVVFVVPARTDTVWFHKLVDYRAELRLFRKRVNFAKLTPDGLALEKANPTDGTLVAIVRHG